MGEVLTLKEASRYLKIHTSTLYRLSLEGRIPASKIGKIWRFKKGDIDKWLEQFKISGKYERFPSQGLPQERRKYSRNNIGLTLELISKTKEKLVGKSIDISESGIKLALSKQVYLFGDVIVSLNISFPPYKLELPTETVWSRRFSGNSQPFCGMQFKDLGREHSIILRKLLWLCDSFIEKNMEGLFQKADGVSFEIGEKVKQFFKRDVKDYLNGICQIQSKIDKDIVTEDEGQATISSMSHNIARKGAKLEDRIDSRIITKEIKRNFREMVDDWAYESEIMKRGFEKPRGYPGDYKMLERIYDNREITEGIGRYFDRFFLDNPYAEAVRNRKVKMFEILQSFFRSCDYISARVLNLASGPCRELKELFENEFNYKGDVTISCVDHDEEALAYSREKLASLPSNVKMSFIKENVLQFSENPTHYSDLFGKQNLIYSIGLIDYLPDRILKQLLHFCLELVAPKGQLIVTHKDRDIDPHAPVPPDWFCDWKFVTRNEEHLINVVKDAMPRGNFKLRTERDGTGKIIFLFVDKA